MEATLSKIITKYISLLGNKRAISVLHDQYQKRIAEVVYFLNITDALKSK